MQGLKNIPIIDLFAGPGGLGEGFSAYKTRKLSFDIRLSIEKEQSAARTLCMRKFYRKLLEIGKTDNYYDYLEGKITSDELFKKHRTEATAAIDEAWQAEMGGAGFPDKEIDRRIKRALNGSDEWVLLGGPPCQAYSLVGRSRMINTHPDFANDHRHFLYRQYLRIIKQHRPSVFIMENVKGILSSRQNGKLIFDKIREDLSEPWGRNKSDGYQIYSLSTEASDPWDLKASDFIIKSEEYGVPQARHRVILIGIRNDYSDKPPAALNKAAAPVSVSDVISGLPILRSRISKGTDGLKQWRSEQKELLQILKDDDYKDRELLRVIRRALSESVPDFSGATYIKARSKPLELADWLYDPLLKGTLNHEARSHMKSDLRRYLFCAAFTELYGRSPKLDEFPEGLLPAHKNAFDKSKAGIFADRFRAQGYNNPATTIVSHISKDGHYYIHPDPGQCRSLTVREAARIQTFPDNYFFEGNRTQQYVQVGNAVPPYLAFQIAGIVDKVITQASVFEKSLKVRRVG